jgi:hypothetical protein
MRREDSGSGEGGGGCGGGQLLPASPRTKSSFIFLFLVLTISSKVSSCTYKETKCTLFEKRLPPKRGDGV